MKCGFDGTEMTPTVQTEEKTIWKCERCGETVVDVTEINKEITGVVIDETTSPQWEVVLRLHGVEICVVAAFGTSPVSADIVVGCADKTLVSAYAEMLRSAAFGIESATNWAFLNGQAVQSVSRDKRNEESVPPWVTRP